MLYSYKLGYSICRSLSVSCINRSCLYYTVYASEQSQVDLSCTPAGPGRHQVYVWWKTCHRLVGTQLLLSLWQHCSHFEIRCYRRAQSSCVQCCPWWYEGNTATQHYPVFHVIYFLKCNLNCICYIWNVLKIYYLFKI